MNLLSIYARVQITDSCWLWTGGIMSKSTGYGRFDTGHERILAHRLIYELVFGPIPKGLVLDHLCRVRLCVNPRHLEPVSHKVNVLRGVGPSARNAVKTHCKRGHPFDSLNTVMRGTRRQCRICIRAASLASKRRRRRLAVSRRGSDATTN